MVRLFRPLEQINKSDLRASGKTHIAAFQPYVSFSVFVRYKRTYDLVVFVFHRITVNIFIHACLAKFK